MKKGLLWTAGFLFVAGSIFLQWQAHRAEPNKRVPNTLQVHEGQLAPEFRLSDLEGAEASLDGYKDKIILIDFWATWCGPCRRSMPLLEKLAREYPQDVVLLAINLEEPESTVRDYVKKRSFKTRVLLDRNGQIGRVYGVKSIPMQVLIDTGGIVRHVQIGFTPFSDDALKREIEALSTRR